MAAVPTILLVEDSKFFASMVIQRIEETLGINVDWRPTYASAVEAIDCCQDNYLLAILDVTLPDAPHGEVVEYALKKGVASIIITAGLSSKLRSQLLSWNIVDYILKDSSTSVDALIHTLSRTQKNRHIKVLVVDDSKPVRQAVVQLLTTQMFQVYQAENGAEALEILERNPEILLVVTDYDMPVMDGFEMTRKIRETRTKNDLAIIGMSASDDELLSVKFIKNGANDFIAKPFQVEEFHCRVAHSVEMLENIALVQDLSYKDPLTRLYNRRYYFEQCDIFTERVTKSGEKYCVGMLDIDHFKNVNDSYGHDAGDIVLKHISSIIAQGFPEDAIVSRFGGEEFCVLAVYERADEVMALFNDVREQVEAALIPIDDTSIQVTLSAGVSLKPEKMDVMLKLADSRLYTAKESGRNRVVGERPSPNVRA